MKVESQPQEFKPITITLETKEDALYMWSLMNITVAQAIRQSAGRLKNREDVASRAMAFFDAFDQACKKQGIE